MISLEKIKALPRQQLEVLWRFLKFFHLHNLDQIIADEIKISTGTVRSHLSHNFRDLNISPIDGRYRRPLFEQTKEHLDEIGEMLGYSPRLPLEAEDINKRDNFITYRNLGVNNDWFYDFYHTMNFNLDQLKDSEVLDLDSELLYYGPGLARNWLETSRLEYESDRRTRFDECVPKLLEKHFIGKTNLIDLGVGDFQMASIIIKYGLDSKNVPQLNYYPLDISYEMISSSLLNEDMDNAKVLSQVLDQKGVIVAINTSFTHLYLYKDLFEKECKNIYLFLGNTIGNVFDPVHTLQLIGRSMRDEDILIIEFQLIEEKPLSDEDLTRKVNEEPKLEKFYKGAFLALGVKDSQIALSVLLRKDDDYSTTYSIECKFSKTTTLCHPSFELPIVVPKDISISVYLVKKFKPEKVESILEQAGFQILTQKTSPTIKPTDRRFLYTVVQRKP